MKRIQEIISKFFNYLYCLVVYHNNYIILNAWIDLKFNRIKKRNFGDELNYYLFQELTGKHIAGYYNIPHLRKQPDLMFIGSLVEEFTTPESIIWGSGAISGDKPLRNKPKQVCAVRGKLTRDYLMKNNVECPEVYGDPALLLPYIYNPSCEKKFEIGLIPHIDDLNHPNVSRLLNDKSVHLINFSEYGDWKDVVKEIKSCKYIISSSLHGLIIADAYNIPNLWIKLSDKLIGGNYKFLDYFSGVGRTTIQPFMVKEDTTLEMLCDKKKSYLSIKFDAKTFISVAPVNIKLTLCF